MLEAVSREECQRVHSDLNTSLQGMRDDLIVIRDNHMPHIDAKLDNIKELTDIKIKAVSDKLDQLRLALIGVGILAGINVLNIFLQYMGV